jgi:hypothetical protein
MADHFDSSDRSDAADAERYRFLVAYCSGSKRDPNNPGERIHYINTETLLGSGRDVTAALDRYRQYEMELTEADDHGFWNSGDEKEAPKQRLASPQEELQRRLAYWQSQDERGLSSYAKNEIAELKRQLTQLQQRLPQQGHRTWQELMTHRQSRDTEQRNRNRDRGEGRGR